VTGESLDFLMSAAGEELLARAAEWIAVGDPVRAVTALRRAYPADQVAAALEQAELRRRARAKFSAADRMLFTRAGLEQASGERVAGWRARRYAPWPAVADLCCGIGGDTRALAAEHVVVAVDRDPRHARLARWNAGGARGPVWAVVGEVPALTPRVQAAFADPGRREGGRRSRSLAAMSPPLTAVVALRERIPHLGVKLSPALDERELATALGALPYELEYLSDGGECKEAVLWLGDLRSAARRASQADRRITLRVEPPDAPVPVGPVGTYLYEPDPAAIRAGAIAMLAAEHRLWKLDEEIAYLSGDLEIRSPWLRGYRVLEALPFSLKPLRAALRARGVADVVVKKRGSAVEPEALRRRLLAGLPRTGESSLVVVLARQRGDPWALVTEAVAESGEHRRGEPSDGLGANG
jgi:SAM-dependent methyltransferase